jgi:cysteine-rich repeat protein
MRMLGWTMGSRRCGHEIQLPAMLQVACLLACGPRLPASEAGDDTTTATETKDSSTETATGTTETNTTETETDTTEADTTETETDGGSGICGDGVVDPGEACDQGPANGPNGACLSDCTFNVCGDGNLGPDEQCDDGNLVDGDGCSAACEDVPTPLFCNGMIFACGDLIDNDDDGLIDTDDIECTSPCDDTENNLCEDLPGAGNSCSVDCAFDSNGGVGDDKCDSDWGCYPSNELFCTPLPPDAPECTVVSPDCVDFCGPLLPNGCDCFGCCELEGQTVKINSIDEQFGCCDLDDLASCSSCELRLDCFNPCDSDACELCFGQAADDLPVDCREPSCPLDRSPCASKDDCPVDWYCQTGCCTPGL